MSSEVSQAEVHSEATDLPPIAIQITGVSKCFKIFERPHDRLKQSISGRLSRMLRGSGKNYFEEFWALRDVSVTIRKGETVGIIGKNGSGKSTLLQILCGTLHPTLGQVTVSGRVCALLELGSGFNPEFTGRENVYLNGTVLGMSRREIDERFADIEAFAEIGDFMDRPVKQYSSGMYVRLAFAIIAHADADILVVDEALSVGDVFFGQKCMRFMRDFMSRGTVVFVSHDTSAVLNLCTRAVWLRDGHVEMDGEARTVTSTYLEDLHYEGTPKQVAGASTSTAAVLVEGPLRDMRQDLINASNLRNDIEIFEFRPDARAFGTGKARIVMASFHDQCGRPISWMVGGETVLLRIVVETVEALESPIIGFEVHDRLGQVIFADNTYLATLESAAMVEAGDCFEAIFEFVMPLMRQGDYTISVAVAEGTQSEHSQHHWMHEALAFHVHPKTICFGLMGVPMQRIELHVSKKQLP